MFVPIQYVQTAIGLLCAVLSIPLAFRMVPMNPSYGVRIRKAYVSEENWYEINAFGGKVLCVSGLLLALFCQLAWDLAPAPTSIWAPVFLAGPLLALGVADALLIGLHARGLPER